MYDRLPFDKSALRSQAAIGSRRQDVAEPLSFGLGDGA
jgi:hypothetical protein